MKSTMIWALPVDNLLVPTASGGKIPAELFCFEIINNNINNNNVIHSV